MNFDAWLDRMTADVRERLAPAPIDWDVDGPCPHCRHASVEIKQDPCCCAATHAPCSACESNWLECPECHAESRDDNRVI